MVYRKTQCTKGRKTLSDSQLTRSSQQDNSTTTASPQTNDHQLPIKHDTSYEKSTSNSTLNEQPMEPTPFPNNTVKTEEVELHKMQRLYLFNYRRLKVQNNCVQ